MRISTPYQFGQALACFLFLSCFPLSANWYSALAEGRCPPGYYPTGGGDAGWLGCAPMGPMEEAAPEEEDGASYASSLPAMNYDPEEWAKWMEIIRKGEEAAEAEKMKDPLYRELKAGTWDFGKEDHNRNTCVAMFLTLRGGVVMMDWKQDGGGTFIGFYGGNIPQTAKVKRAKVTLTQSGEKQKVTAFHAPLPWRDSIGMIMFAVPSTQALISSIEDRQDFEVEMDGQALVWGEWHNGTKAKAHLARCTSGR